MSHNNNNQILFDLIKESVDFYNSQIQTIKITKEDSYFKLLLFQYCLISTEFLETIYHLLQNKKFISAAVVFRSLFEYYITTYYLHLNSDKNVEIFLAHSYNEERKMINEIKDISNVSIEYHQYVQKKDEIEKLYKNYKEKIKLWPKYDKMIKEISTNNNNNWYLIYRH